MKSKMKLWMCLVVSVLVIACQSGGPEPTPNGEPGAAPHGEPEAMADQAGPEGEGGAGVGGAGESPSEAASQPTSQPSADDHAGHDHAANDHAAAPEHTHDAIGAANVLAEGDYDPAAVVAQPGASVGDVTHCPVSGAVFRVTEDAPYFEHQGQKVYFCCASCVRPFQRDPSTYLASATAHAAGPVTLTAEGTRFDPPIAKTRVPAGGWMCDMGTVHYAQSEQGQGTCPICNMRLIQQE